jgi:hypothetical protein
MVTTTEGYNRPSSKHGFGSKFATTATSGFKGDVNSYGPVNPVSNPVIKSQDLNIKIHKKTEQ